VKSVKTSQPNRFFNIIDTSASAIKATEEERNRILIFGKDFFARLLPLSEAPIAKGGNLESLQQKTPSMPFMLSSFALELNRFARWYALKTLKTDPQSGLEAILAATRTGRHLNSEPTFTTFLIKLESDLIALKTLTELAPQMTPVRRLAVRLYWDSLPNTGTIEGALNFERDFYLKQIENALHKKSRAWQESQKEIEPESHIHWEVLLAVFTQDFPILNKDESVDSLKKQLTQMRLMPKTALKTIQEAQNNYTAMLGLLEIPYIELEAWFKDHTINNYFNATLPYYAEQYYRSRLYQKAFYFGLDILDGAVNKPVSGNVVQYGDEWFRYIETTTGFRIEQTWNIPASATPENIPHFIFHTQ